MRSSMIPRRSGKDPGTVPGLQHRRSNDNECGHPTVYPQLGALDPDPPRRRPRPRPPRHRPRRPPDPRHGAPVHPHRRHRAHEPRHRLRRADPGHAPAARTRRRRPLVVPRRDDLPARGRAARRRGRGPAGASRSGTTPDRTGTRADGGAELPSAELSGQRITVGQGGGRGIRTHDGCNPIAVFKTAAIGHYASPPSRPHAV
jgi:hypothetical protein